MILKSIIGILFITILWGCQGKSEESNKLTSDFGEPKKLAAFLQTDFKPWWNYHKKHIILSSNFIPLDIDAKQISKKNFLLKLLSGDYLAIKLNSEDAQDFYKLYRLGQNPDPSMVENIIDDAGYAYKHFSMEGQRLPYFDFTDLMGEQHNWDNTRGKSIIINTWFTGCAPCIKEMPALNELVKLNSDNESILFLSLALDDHDKLKAFLTKRDFDYVIVPKAGKFINQKLKLSTYPTHIIVNDKGIIQKVISNMSELNWALEEFIEDINLPVEHKQLALFIP